MNCSSWCSNVGSEKSELDSKMVRVKFDERNKLWSSVDDGTSSPFDPRLSLGHILLNSMKLFGPRLAQISDDTGERCSFEEIRIKTIRVAQHLQEQGYKREQVIGIVAGNVSQLAPIVFAAFCSGCSINPVFTGADKPTIVRIFQLSQPSLIFCEVNMYDLIAECMYELGNNAKIFTFNGTRGDSSPVEDLFEKTGTEEDFVPTKVDGINDIAAIMSSSGTVQSKGVCISQASLASQIGTMKEVFEGKVFFSNSSLFWFSGLRSLLLGTINGATRIITTDPLPPEQQMRLIERNKVNVVVGASYNVLDILKSGILSEADLSSVEHMFLCGCSVPFYMRKELNSHLTNGEIHNEYGLTEVGPIAIDFPGSSGVDTVGTLLNGFTVKIVDDEGNRCGAGVDGEICIKSRYKFLGYYKDIELTEKAFDNEGFLLTGDIGHIDDVGYLYIVDRKKDVIIYDAWVYPSEIEEVLLKSVDIKTVCVVGVPYNPIVELPAAVVVRFSHSEIGKGDIHKMVEDNLGDDCKLRGGVYFVDSIPTTASGKPLRRVVKETATRLYRAEIGKQSTEK